jgi:hypothetical protein
VSIIYQVAVYNLGVSFWVLVLFVMAGGALIAALLRKTSRGINSALGREVERMRESYEHVSAAFHEPMPSSPSHPSYPPPL